MPTRGIPTYGETTPTRHIGWGMGVMRNVVTPLVGVILVGFRASQARV